MPQKHLVIIPTYNEVENIASIIKAVWQAVPKLHILVVDDNSQDGTQEVLETLKQQFPEQQLFTLYRSGKLGLGTAYIAGFKWALSRSYDALIEMDADFSHDPAVLPTMIAELENHDVVIGSRYTAGGGTQNWNFFRRLLSRFGSYYSRFILGVPIWDLTGGFNGWRAKAIEAIGPDTITSEGYSFQVELKFRAHLCGFDIKETPIIFTERRAGKSKMSSKIIIEAMMKIWIFRFKANYYRQLNNSTVPNSIKAQ